MCKPVNCRTCVTEVQEMHSIHKLAAVLCSAVAWYACLALLILKLHDKEARLTVTCTAAREQDTRPLLMGCSYLAT